MAQLTPDQLPCICGSGRSLSNCCLQTIKNEEVPKIDLKSNKKKTGYSNPNCYLRSTNDCSRELSQEHYVSASVLKLIDDRLAVQGFPWIRTGEHPEIPAEKFTSGVLSSGMYLYEV